MPLLTSVLLKMGVSQPLQRFINELLVLLLIVPGRSTFRNFRDSKPFAGLTHCQARRTEALTFQVKASLTAVSISKLQAFQTHGQRVRTVLDGQPSAAGI